MNEYISRGKEILRILTNNGFEAYFIGEVVRNTILDKEITRVDITTSAHLDIIRSIFKNCETEDIDEHSLKLRYNDYDFILQTFIYSEGIDKNTLLSKHYSKNLLDDLANRDYTINAIAMSHSGKLTDAYSGFTDLQKKRICHIGVGKLRFSKEPVLMLKAFALVSELNYKIVKKTRSAIIKRRKCIEDVPVKEYYDILKKIFEGPYAHKAIYAMESTKIHKYIPELKKVIIRLNNFYKKVSIEEVLLMSCVLEGKMSDTYKDCIDDYATFVTIFALAMANKKGKYDNQSLYTNGLEICLEANRINYLLGKAHKKEKRIKKQWDKLPIKSIDDLDYKKTDLMRIINKSDFAKIEDVFDNVATAVLNGNLNNIHAEIETYILGLLPRFDIVYDLDGITDVEEFLKQEENNQRELVNEENETISEDNINLDEFNESEDETDLSDDLTSHRLDMLEQKFEEQSRMMKEKQIRLQEMENQRLKNDIDLIINNTFEYLNNNDSLKNLIKDPEEFKTESQRFIYDYIKDQGDE